MPTLDFPSSPSNGDTYQNYVYNGTVGAWQLVTTTTTVSGGGFDTAFLTMGA